MLGVHRGCIQHSVTRLLLQNTHTTAITVSKCGLDGTFSNTRTPCPKTVTLPIYNTIPRLGFRVKAPISGYKKCYRMKARVATPNRLYAIYVDEFLGVGQFYRYMAYVRFHPMLLK
jgi:hypothetical protein